MTEAFFWSQPISENSSSETESTTEEEKLLSILNHLNKEDITWNKHLAGITPEYGFHLIIGDDDYYINQAEASQGQTEISFNGKQW